jgi:competence protein CoiA
MKTALTSENRKIKATPDSIGFCQECKKQMIPKCGTKKKWHWSHYANASHELKEDDENDWHLEWQDVVGNSLGWDYVEVQMDNASADLHYADVQLPNGLVIEFQHSHISIETIRAREDFYKNMIWILDGETFDNARPSTMLRFGRYYIDYKDYMEFYDTVSGFHLKLGEIKYNENDEMQQKIANALNKNNMKEGKDNFINELRAGRVNLYEKECQEVVNRKINENIEMYRDEELNRVKTGIEKTRHELEIEMQHRIEYLKINIEEIQAIRGKLFRENQQLQENMKNEVAQRQDQLEREMKINIEKSRQEFFKGELEKAKADAIAELKQADVVENIKQHALEQINGELFNYREHALQSIQNEIEKAKITEMKRTPSGQLYCPKCMKESGLKIEGNALVALIPWSEYEQKLKDSYKVPMHQSIVAILQSGTIITRSALLPPDDMV